MDQVASEFLTTAEIAALLRVRPATIVALVRRGELPAIRLAGAAGLRIRRADLEAFIAARTTPASDGPA